MIRPWTAARRKLGAFRVVAQRRERIIAFIDALARPDHRLFAFESLGAMLGAYERRLPRRLAGLAALDRPEPRAWVAGFEPEVSG